MTANVEAERWVPMSLRRAEGERGLLRALLMDAVRCALGEAGGRQANRAQLAAEARRWITRADVGEPFAFENVCAWLGLPAHRLRRFVLERVELLRPSAPIVARQGASRHPGALSARLREDRNARIRKFRATGWKPRDIAERFDLSYASVIAICTPDGAEEIEESEGARHPETTRTVDVEIQSVHGGTEWQDAFRGTCDSRRGRHAEIENVAGDRGGVRAHRRPLVAGAD